MENDNVEIFEQSDEVSNSDTSSSEQSSVSEEVETVVSETSSDLDRADEQSEIETDLNHEEVNETENDSDFEEESEEVSEEESEEEIEEDSEEETPSSTIIQVLENPDSDLGYDTIELDVESLNTMAGAYVEQMLAVTPTSNDYYAFIESPILEYMQGVLDNYPLNEYRAYHLRHYVSSSQYYSYYDDYYYLFYDFDDESAEQCLEIYKANGSNSYSLTWGTAEVLNASIMYGSSDNMSDIRGGVSHVETLALLSAIGVVAVLYVLNAIFRHIRS